MYDPEDVQMLNQHQYCPNQLSENKVTSVETKNINITLPGVSYLVKNETAFVIRIHYLKDKVYNSAPSDVDLNRVIAAVTVCIGGYTAPRQMRNTS